MRTRRIVTVGLLTAAVLPKATAEAIALVNRRRDAAMIWQEFLMAVSEMVGLHTGASALGRHIGMPADTVQEWLGTRSSFDFGVTIGDWQFDGEVRLNPERIGHLHFVISGDSATLRMLHRRLLREIQQSRPTVPQLVTDGRGELTLQFTLVVSDIVG